MDVAMSENVELNVNEVSIERLRCCICENYLSCAPIHVLPNGNSVCSQCSPPERDVQMYRQLTLEALLSNAIFPCKYKQNGCSIRLSFGSSVDHEATCSYRPSEVEQPQLQVKKPPDMVSQDGDFKHAAYENESTDVTNPTANVSGIKKPKCSNSCTATASSSVTLNSNANTDAPASTSGRLNWANNSNALPGPGSTRSFNPNLNSSRRASTSSNRSYNPHWNAARAASDRMRNYGYNVHWNNHGPRNNWARDWHYPRPGFQRRDLFFHKRSNRNSVVIIKGGTFYINF